MELGLELCWCRGALTLSALFDRGRWGWRSCFDFAWTDSVAWIGRWSCKRRWRLCLLQVATGGGWAMRWILYHLLSTRILAFFAQFNFNQPVVVKKTERERGGEGQLQRHIYPNDARSKPIQSSLNGQCHCMVSKITTSSKVKWNREWNNLNNVMFHFTISKAKQNI